MPASLFAGLGCQIVPENLPRLVNRAFNFLASTAPATSTGPDMNSTTPAAETEMEYNGSSAEGITPPSVIAVGAVLPGLAAIAVGLRFYARVFKRQASVGAEDWMILLSLFLTVGMGIMLIVGSSLHGLAQPTPQGIGPKGFLTVMSPAIELTEKLFFAFNLTQCWSFGTCKLSVLLFYRRIFRGNAFDIMSYTLMAIVGIWTVGFFFALLFRCGTNFWALWAPLKYLIALCYQSTPMFQALCISDVLTDVLILALPVHGTMRLQMTRAKRVAVAGVFLLGGVVIGAGVARLVIFMRQTYNPYQNADGIGHLTTEMYWTMLEMGIAVVAACLPTIWPLVSKVSLETIFRSVRSFLSLDSFARTRQSQSGADSRKTADGDHSDSERSGRHDQFTGTEKSFTGTRTTTVQVDIEAQQMRELPGATRNVRNPRY